MVASAFLVGTGGNAGPQRTPRATRLRFAVSVFLLMMVCGAPASGANERPVLIGHPGIWTLHRLGLAAVDFPVAPRTRSRRVNAGSFRLPSSAHQGRGSWYLIHLHFQIVFARTSRSGEAYVSAATGSLSDLRTSAQLIFKVRRQGRQLSVASDSLGLVAGHQVKETHRRSHASVFDNYIPYRGIRPGINALTFQLEQYGGVSVEKLVFFPDSGIRYSKSSPVRLSLGVRTDHQKVAVGDQITIFVDVQNTGGTPAKRIMLGTSYSPSELEAVASPSMPIMHLGAGKSTQQKLVFRALRKGLHEVDVQATGGLSQPLVPLRVLVTDGPAGAGGRPWRWLLAASVLLLAFGAIPLFRALKRTP
jgi:hypothetical protein